MRYLALIAIFTLLNSCGQKNKVSHTNSPVFINSCSVFQSDTRKDFNPLDQSKVQYSIAQMIPKSNLINMINGQTTFNSFKVKRLSHHTNANLCHDERFANRYNLGKCTGFLISKNHLMTSGHCMLDTKNDTKLNCERFVWSFNVKGINHVFNQSNTYQCDKVIALEVNENSKVDYAIIKLKRPVKDRAPLELETSSQNIKNRYYLPHAIIGHPLGMGLIKATNSIEIEYKGKYINHYLPTNKGSSGSPIINLETGKVIAIHKAADNNPFIYDEENKCNRFKICSTNDSNCPASIATLTPSINNVISKCNP